MRGGMKTELGAQIIGQLQPFSLNQSGAHFHPAPVLTTEPDAANCKQQVERMI